MSKQTKQTKILKGLIIAVSVLLALELCWLFGMSRGSGNAVDHDTTETEDHVLQVQEETTITQPMQTETVQRMPWEEPDAKQPGSYTWEEYELLTDLQQKAFRDYLGAEGFEDWRNQVRDPAEANPWDTPGAKQPEDYTWEEFEQLTGAQQIAFQNYFGLEGFTAWMERAQDSAEMPEMPWDSSGAKQPDAYSLEEFEALSAEEQMAFQNALGSEGFAEWLNRVQSQQETDSSEESGVKPPEAYTWEEFEALSAEEQMAFQNALGAEGFEKWLNRVQGQPETNPSEESGVKPPEAYTWEEFEALSAEEQMAFQNALGPEGFEEWLNRAQNQSEENPWEKPGAKSPEAYSWEEFENLTAAQQIAFQNHLGPEAFDTWLNTVLESAEKP